MNPRTVLVIGATGYFGGRLVPRLLQSGYRVRATARSAAKLSCRPWTGHSLLEPMEADVLDLDSTRRAFAGCQAAFYLARSTNAHSKGVEETDWMAAQNVATAAAEAGLERIVCLLRLEGDEMRPSGDRCLSSREIIGVFRAAKVPATFLRVPMVLGSGNASFEILRYLSERLPVMITPRWTRTRIQPIAVRNVLAYLEGCLEHDEVVGQTYDIGGPDVLTFEDLIETYCEVAEISRRHMMPVPFFAPRLSAYWIHLFTPVPMPLSRCMVEALYSGAVCSDNRIRSIIPQRLLHCREAIQLALKRIEQTQVETCWTDVGALIPPEWVSCGDAGYGGGTILECGYRIRAQAAPEEVWEPVVRIGGRTGWYYGRFLWRLRGLLDRIMGGVDLDRGRRHPRELYSGDALDFWRVLEVDPPRRLILLAEMKVPGEAVLEFTIHELNGGQTELRQVARFLPKGLWGIIYWYGLYPFHLWIFRGMLRSIAGAVGKPLRRGPERFRSKGQQSCDST